MKYQNNQKNKGAAVLIYVAIVSILATLLLLAASARSLLALRRQSSSFDNIASIYDAESELNDIMAKLEGGYNIAFPFSYSKTIGDTTLEISGTEENNKQTVVITARRAFAVNRIEGVREIFSSGSASDVEIVFALDCTGSMDKKDSGIPEKTRLDMLEDAVVGFMDSLIELEDNDRFRMGALIFSGNSNWLTYGGIELKPNSGLSHEQFRSAIEYSFNSIAGNSPGCVDLFGGTSIGTGFLEALNYFDTNVSPSTKQIVVLVTDGMPNTRIPEDRCPVSVYCPGHPGDSCSGNSEGWACSAEIPGPPYPDETNKCMDNARDLMRCVLADTETVVNYETALPGNGIRRSEIDAYGVVVYDGVSGPVRSIFQNYSTRYFNPLQAKDLPQVLDEIFEDIVTKASTIRVKRIIPEP